MTYIQDKLDELIETYRKETGFTEYDARMIAERLVADYHNHIVDVLVDKIEEFANSHSDHDMKMAVMDTIDFIRVLQDTNPKE